jgi:hypothetical protein
MESTPKKRKLNQDEIPRIVISVLGPQVKARIRNVQCPVYSMIFNKDY